MLNTSFLVTLVLILFRSEVSFGDSPYSGSQTAPTASRYSLEQCYDLALKRSDTVATQIESVNQAEEHIRESFASFIPSLNVSSNLTTQQAPSNPLLASIFTANQTTLQSTVKENLFNGFRDFNTLKQRNLEKEAAAAAREQAKVQLFQDTAQAFYNVLAYEHDIVNYQNEIASDQKRKEDLAIRMRVAQAREADLVSIDSSIASLEASVSGTQGLLDATRESLSFLTGLPPETEISDSESYPEKPGDLEKWLGSYEKRPDVLQAKWNLDAADKSVNAAWGAHLPAVDFLADYYFARPGIYTGINWDVQLNITIPIFSGGLTQALVREAASQREQRDITLDQTRKEAERDIRSAYKSFAADLDQVTKLEKAAKLAERNYELLVKDNREGIATNIDVLQALANAHELKRTWDHARFSTKYDYAKLQIISSTREMRSNP